MAGEERTAVATVVTLLFTDLVGSSSLLERQGEEGAERTRRAHFRVLREAIAGRGGHEVKNLGDGLMVAFSSALDAVQAAIAMQRAIARYNTSAAEALHVRVGLHVGEPIREEDDYFGTPVVVAKRLCDAAAGGEILASDLVRGLVAGRGGIEFVAHGELQLKGLSAPVTTCAVTWRAPEPVSVPRDAAAPGGQTMVGRRDEIAVLTDAFSRCRVDGFRVVLVTGEAGVGKTRVTREFETTCRGEAVTLVARANPFGAATSFGLWVEALERHLRGLDPDRVLQLSGAFTNELSAILPSVAAAAGAYPSEEPARLRLLASIAALLANLASQQPVVLALDDAHLADTSSWEALVYLAAHLRSSPVLVVLIARPGELSALEVPSDVLVSVEQDGVLSRLVVAPFGAADVGRLAALAIGEEEAPAELVDWLLDRAKGSPLFTLGLVRALVDEGADLRRPELQSLPEDLMDRVAARLRVLDAASLSVLEILAVMAYRVDLSDLLTITGRTLDALADILELLVRGRFVVEEERGRELTYEILHPLVQEAIYRTIGGARRRALHRLVGRTLAEAGRPGSAAPHFVRAADPGDPEAVDALKDALRQAEARELSREALTVLDALLDLLPPHDERWLDVLDSMAWQAEWVVEHRADVTTSSGVRAMRVLENLLQGRHDPARLAVVRFHLSSFLTWGMGEVAEGRRSAEQARDLFREAGDDRAAQLVENELSYIAGIEGDLDAHGSIARGIAVEATAGGDRALEMQARISLLFSLLFTSAGYEETSANLTRALQIAQEDGKRYRAVYLRAIQGFITAHTEGAAGCWAHFDSAFADTEMYPQTLALEFALMTARVVGDHTRGSVLARELASTFGSRPGIRRGWGWGAGAACLAEAGRAAEAERMISVGEAVYGGRDWWVHSDVVVWGRGVVDALAGRADEALVPLRRAASRHARIGSWAFGPAMFVDLAEVALEARRPDIIDEAVSFFADQGLRHPWQRAMRALAVACRTIATGEVEAEAVATTALALEQARATFEGLGWQGYLARTDVLLARCVARTDRAHAAARLEEAAATFDSSGAVVRAGWARQALAELGTRSSPRASPGELTRREREVVDLAVEGLTAKEIGQRLFIGERTVESHLARAYAKLGVSSRLELVRRVSSLDER